LPFVKALGFRLHTRGLVQVSMNLVNYEVTGMSAAYDAIHRESNRLGVEIDGTEIVGLVPQDAVGPSLALPESKILEHQIRLCQSV
jgi:glutamate formiminotransferase